MYLLEEQQASDRYSGLLNDLYLTDEGACGHALGVYCVSRRLPSVASDFCGTKCLVVTVAQKLFVTVSTRWIPNILLNFVHIRTCKYAMEYNSKLYMRGALSNPVLVLMTLIEGNMELDIISQ